MCTKYYIKKFLSMEIYSLASVLKLLINVGKKIYETVFDLTAKSLSLSINRVIIGMLIIIDRFNSSLKLTKHAKIKSCL